MGGGAPAQPTQPILPSLGGAGSAASNPLPVAPGANLQSMGQYNLNQLQQQVTSPWAQLQQPSLTAALNRPQQPQAPQGIVPPQQAPQVTPPKPADGPSLSKGEKFQNLLKSLGNIINSAATVKQAFTRPPKQRSGGIIRGGGNPGLPAASGASLRGLGQIQIPEVQQSNVDTNSLLNNIQRLR